MSDLKTIILSGMKNGKNVLAELDIAKKIGKGFDQTAGATERKTNQYHPKKLFLKVSEIKEIGNFAKCFKFSSLAGSLPIFEAGQYINIFVKINGILTSRPYSISSSPKQRAYYELIIARQKDGFISNYFIDEVKVGDEFEANGPSGVFHFNPIFHKKHQVFLAGGSGITPFLSMSREILSAGIDRKVDLIYGCRNDQLAIAHEELTKLSNKHSNFNYNLIVSDDNNTTKYRKGFIDAECINALVENPLDATYYICGPEIMNKFCKKVLTEMKVPSQHIRREVFGAKQNIQEETGWPKALTGKEQFTVTMGDKKFPAVSGEPILTAIERSGNDIKVLCRSGGCSYCRGKLISGDVFVAPGAKNRHADKLFNYIHSCKTYPISDIEIKK